MFDTIFIQSSMYRFPRIIFQTGNLAYNLPTMLFIGYTMCVVATAIQNMNLTKPVPFIDLI